MSNQYPLMGSFSIVPSAEFSADDSAINIKSAARLGDAGAGKRAGMLVIKDNGAGDYDLALATGDAPTDPWIIFGRESTVTPS